MGPLKIASVPDVIMLIQEIRKNAPCLWNPNDAHFNNRFHVGLAWKKISKKMGRNEHVLRVKWKNLKDTFKKEQKKFPCEDLSSYKGKWIYFEHLYYLKQYDMNYKDIEVFLEEPSDNDQDNNDDDNDSSDDDGNQINGINIVNIKQEVEESDDNDEEYSTNNLNENKMKSAKKRKLNDAPNEISFVNVESDREASSKDYEYDEMFLKSLTPFFTKLDSMRKLILRGRFQDILMSELAAQQSSKK